MTETFRGRRAREDDGRSLRAARRRRRPGGRAGLRCDELAGGRAPCSGVFGRLDPHKGHREILAVLPRLRERLDVRAIFVGADDPAHAGYREQLAARSRPPGSPTRSRCPASARTPSS